MKFTIEMERWHWIRDDGEDDPEDLCLHGDVTVTVGEWKIREISVNLSASAMMFLRALTEDHRAWTEGTDGGQLLPEGGFCWLASEDAPQSVWFSGSPWGTDWTVLHEEGAVHMILPDGASAWLNQEDFRREVIRYADRIEAAYHQCLPKPLPQDRAERAGYFTFWSEWNRRKI